MIARSIGRIVAIKMPKMKRRNMFSFMLNRTTDAIASTCIDTNERKYIIIFLIFALLYLR